MTPSRVCSGASKGSRSVVRLLRVGTCLPESVNVFLIEDHIVDGDLVLIESRKSARDGETVVAVVEGETTLKRLYREGRGTIRLQPANEELEPRVYPAAQVEIRGVLRGVIRRS